MVTGAPSSASTASNNPDLRKKKSAQSMRVVTGTIAIVAWLCFFSAGMLIETTSWRRVLAPEALATRGAVSSSAFELPLKYLIDRLFPPKDDSPSAVLSFFAATLCFTPTNLAFLAILAGLVGGCASNVVAEQMRPEDKAKMDPERLMKLEETPWASAMRSFIVYLCIIAGLYLSVDDPFKNPTSAQYLRLAGLVSALAFVVGYDPSRIQQWIRLLPSPMQVKADNVNMAEQQTVINAPPNERKSKIVARAYNPADRNGDGALPHKKRRRKAPK